MFENIVGNEQNKVLLENIIKNNKITHSYLFLGPHGVGKFLFAMQFANAILGQSECKVDLNIIDEGNESIKNEQIKELNSKILEKPIQSAKKVYIINNSEKMTKEAQNSLLKTLEEPPEYAVIILICGIENLLLNTIKSRCTKINFKRLTNQELKQISGTNSKVLELCGGNLEKINFALENESLYREIEEIFTNIKSINIIDFINYKEKFFTKENATQVLEYINVLMYNFGYLNAIKTVEQAKDKLIKNNNFDMTIDNFLFTIWEDIND